MSVLIDPVSVEDLARFRELTLARDNIAHRLLSLKLEEISIIAAGKRVDEEHDVLLRRVMTDRGIPLSSAVKIDPQTGEVGVTAAESRPAEAGVGSSS